MQKLQKERCPRPRIPAVMPHRNVPVPVPLWAAVPDQNNSVPLPAEASGTRDDAVLWAALASLWETVS